MRRLPALPAAAGQRVQPGGRAPVAPASGAGRRGGPGKSLWGPTGKPCNCNVLPSLS